MLVRAPVTWARWWRPGRVETCRHGEEEMRLYSFCSSPLSSAGCSGFADCLLPLPQLLTFPVDFCAGRCWACASLRSCWSPRLYIRQCLEYTISLPKITSSALLSDPCYCHRAWWFFHAPIFCELSTTRVRLRLVHLHARAVDNESSTRCHTQAVPPLIALRTSVSQNLPSTQTKLSANSLQMQPFVS